MTSSINTFGFPKNLNLTIINNSSKLSSYEQMYDSSFEVADFLSTFVFKIASIPLRAVRRNQGHTKKKKR